MTPQTRVPKPPAGVPKPLAAFRAPKATVTPRDLAGLPPLRTLREPRPTLEMQDVIRGVTVGWLAKVFGMDPLDVKRRLADCPSIQRGKMGHTYDLKAACRFLLKPAIDIEKYVQSMKPSELPAQLQDQYWKAKLSRQRFELNAGDLWRTGDVIEVLGDVFKTLKTTTQLWADNLEQQSNLQPKQREHLTRMVDALQSELHEKLVALKDVKRTPPSLEEETDVESFI